jgi:hypothetical protein
MENVPARATPELVLAAAEQGQIRLLHPETGEVLDLETAALAELESYVDALERWRELAAAARALVDGEATRRADAALTRTLRDGDVEVEVDAPAGPEYPRAELERVERGELTREAAAGVWRKPPAPPPPQPSRRALALLERMPGVSERLAAIAVEPTRPRRARWRRAGR